MSFFLCKNRLSSLLIFVLEISRKEERTKLKYFWISFVFFRNDHMKLGSLIHCCLLRWVYITGYYRVVHVSHLFHISHYRRVCLFINFGHNKIGFYLFCSWHSNKVQKPLRHMQRSSARRMWEEHRKKSGRAGHRWSECMACPWAQSKGLQIDKDMRLLGEQLTPVHVRVHVPAQPLSCSILPFFPSLLPPHLSLRLSLDSRVLALPVIPKGVIILYAGAVACFCCRCQWLRHRLLRLQHSTVRV